MASKRPNVLSADEIEAKRLRRLEYDRNRRLNQNEQQVQLDREAAADRARRRRERGGNVSHRLSRNTRSRNTALVSDNFDENQILEHYLGPMSETCTHCHAKYFKDEIQTNCCQKGTVNLPQIHTHPVIQNYLEGVDSNSKNFRNNVRSYNSAMAFASMGAQIDDSVTRGQGPFSYRIHGQIYHRTSGLHPDAPNKPSYAQLYILDSTQATNYRMEHSANDTCIREIMESLHNLLGEINPFSRLYKNMLKFEEEEMIKAGLEGRSPKEVCMTFLRDKSVHPGRTNAPTVMGEIAAIFQSADGEPPFNRDIVIHSKSSGLQHINILSKHCDPMCYPILFPFGDSGWTTNIKKNEMSENQPKSKNVSHLQWYSYHFAVRDYFNQFLSAGKLTQQFFVDAYCRTEANRLHWIKENQPQLRAEDYDVLAKYVNNNIVEENIVVGRKVILPSSFQGSPRNMQQNYQDAMAMVRKYGKPDLFITFTCNPKLKEISENLLSNQQPTDRPDLVARVFQLKLKALLKDLKEKHIFGRVKALLHVIEFQKRGLPHAHILAMLIPEDKAWDKEKINKIVCAELPIKIDHPRLFEIIKGCMIHGPCGALNPNAPCMENKKCKKDFPKDFCYETNANLNGYPKYERKDDGNSTEICGHRIDNRWIVPYNPYLSLKYNGHINVEICSSIQSVKYLFKYVYKGHDCINVGFQTVGSDENESIEWDEVKRYIETRYVSAAEACWRLREYEMHHQTHHIERLNIHLEDKHTICFNVGNEANAVVQKATKSKLLAWFKLNQNDVNAGRFLYIEIPEHYTWNDKSSTWTPRKRGGDTTIGRMYTVSPTDREKYFLRLLLLHVKGATCFEDLRKVDGIPATFESYQAACIARGLLDDDNEWDTCLNEAEIIQMPIQLRQLFAFICVSCEPADPLALFERHKQHLIEDYVRQTPNLERAEFMALKDIEQVLKTHGKNLHDFGLPNIPEEFYLESSLTDNFYDILQEKAKYEEQYASLNPEQKHAFDKIVDAIENNNYSCRTFFLDGPGGSGKTYLYNTLMHFLRSQSKEVLACAFTGIAATLLAGGKTSHSRFKLPVPLTETSTCNVRPNSKLAKQLKNASLLIWDEATMAPSHGVNAVDSLFRELNFDPMVHVPKPFGNSVFLFGGDFRQTLPVLPHGNRTQIIASCIKNSKCWKEIETIKLIKNMRANILQPDNENLLDFSEWLIQLGDGLLHEPGLDEGIFEIPPICVVKDSIVDAIFPEVITPDEVHLIANIAILTPKNDDALKISEDVLKRIQTECKTYLSVDSINTDTSNAEENNNYPLEFLNSLTPGGMPPHKVNLKVGAVVILLRNLDPSRALCNGTRLVVKQMMNRLLDCEVLTGSSKGSRVFIPRIILAPSDPDLPFTIKRKQFPIRLAFGMTINRSQGQTLEKVGIYLPAPVFSHGQLYVAFSRTKSFQQVKVKVESTDEQGNLKNDGRTFTKNVVYKEVLAD